LRGGKPGVLGYTLIRSPGEDKYEMSLSPRVAGKAGTEVIFRTSGGGGWGSPLERDTDRVLRDVIEGYISAEKAYEDYGVVLSADRKSVVEEATRSRREALAAKEASL
jgi:N-methylhydantoinase B